MSAFDEHGGVNTPESAVLTGVANLVSLIFVTTLLAVAWVVATALAIYYSITTNDGTVGQSLATNSLASLLLLLVAPLLFSLVLRKSRWHSIAVAVGAAAILLLAPATNGALRDFLINLGTGLWFVLAIDFNILHRFKVWRTKLEARAQEAAEQIQLVL